MRKVLLLLAAPAILLAARTAGAQSDDGPEELTRNSIPQKWLEPFLPERLPPLEYPAYFNDLDKTEAQVFHGRFKLSLITLAKAEIKKPEERLKAALAKGRALAALGRTDEALAALSQAGVAEAPEARSLSAQVLADAGRTGEALDVLKRELSAAPDSISGHYLLGTICEQVGDHKGARSAFEWFAADPQNFLKRWAAGGKGFESAQDVTWIGRGLDRWASLTQAYGDNSGLHGVILNIFVKAYDEIDRGYWPARVAAAEYFMSHDQRKEAGEELEAALAANPNDVRALQLAGRISLETFDFDGADRAISAIRDVNPDSTVADLLEARNLLLQRRPQDAEAPVKAVLAKQPKNLEAMGLLAAVNALQLKEEQTNEILKQVEEIDPQNATAYYEVAQQLAAMRQYPRSAAKYDMAVQRAPWWTAARNGLGLLYTQSGDEGKAYQVLDAAHKLDPFNLATTNYLRLLDMMLPYKHVASEHFELIFDPKTDPVLPEYFLDYLESVHQQICSTFHYTPTAKTLIEVFPSHEAFSVRTTGSSWIPTVGASTGRVIALVAPRGGQKMGPFNWAQVLRHEYTHTVTLGATDNRIQHWMTEGLAVWEEQTPIQWAWVPMLYHTVKGKHLFPLDQLTWAFIRPKRPIDRQLAYAESYWIIRYVEEKYGHGTILKMLDDCRNAEPQEVFFPKETGRSPGEFMSDFQTWCEKQVESWGYDADSSKKYEELKTKGEGLIKEKQYDDAVAVWEEIAALRPVDAMPHERLAGLYLKLKNSDKAVEQLEILQKVELKDNRFSKRIARLLRDGQQWEPMAKYALSAVYIDPFDRDAHELLLMACEKTGDETGAAREKRVMESLDKLKEAQEGAESSSSAGEGGGR